MMMCFPRTLALFPEDRCAAVASDASIVQLRSSDMRLPAAAMGRLLGWPGSCGGICGWTSSGPSACRRTAGKMRWDEVLQVLVSYRD